MSYITVPVSYFKNFNNDFYNSTTNRTLLNAIAESTGLTTEAIYEAAGFKPTEAFNENNFYFRLDRICNSLNISLIIHKVIASMDDKEPYYKIDLNFVEKYGQSHEDKHIAQYGCNYEALKYF